MIARLSIYANVDLEMADRLKTWMDARGGDAFESLPGYRGSMTLVDRDNARLVGIGFYETMGDAHEADAQLAELYARGRTELPEDLRRSLDMRPESQGLYEVADATGLASAVPAHGERTTAP